MADEEIKVPEDKGKKGSNPILIIIISVLVAVILTSGISFFLIKTLTSNIQNQESDNLPTASTSISKNFKADLISDGARYPIMLKGGNDIAVVDALSFTVGSEECRSIINENNVEIKQSVRMIFLNKTKAEVTTPQGVELLSKQIRDAVNEITGFTGEREGLGVIKVNMIILTIQKQ